jgi:hypothetical protein
LRERRGYRAENQVTLPVRVGHAEAALIVPEEFGDGDRFKERGG